MNNISKKQIQLGAIISYFTLIINSISSLIYLPWMVSAIGKGNYALYTLANSVISLFMVDFGLSASVSRFITKYNAEGDSKEKINSFVSTVEKIYLFIDIILLIILSIVFLFLDKIYIGLSNDEITQFRFLYVIVAIYSLVSFPCVPFTGILNAYEKFIELKLCELVSKFLIIVLTVIVILMGYGVLAVVFASVIGGLFSSLIKYIIIRRDIEISFNINLFDKKIIKDIFSFSLWITIISISQRCIFNLTPTILGIVSDSDQIASFAPSNTLESYFYSISAAVDGLFLPTISRYIANEEYKKIFDLLIRVGRYQFMILGLIICGFACVGKDFMLFWMGEDYVLAYPCALCLFFADLLLFTQTIANTAMIAMNEVRVQSYGYIMMAVVCVSLSLFLCGNYGALGSAAAIAISYFTLFVYMNFQYKKVLNINVRYFFKKCYLALGVPMIMSLILSYSVCIFINTNKLWLNILIKAIIVTAIYFMFMVKRLDQYEKVVIKKGFHIINTKLKQRKGA